jgi:hypothetical protein
LPEKGNEITNAAANASFWMHLDAKLHSAPRPHSVRYLKKKE